MRTYDSKSTPALATLAGEPVNGSWSLELADHAAQDIGKLNHWELRIYRDAGGTG